MTFRSATAHDSILSAPWLSQAWQPANRANNTGDTNLANLMREISGGVELICQRGHAERHTTAGRRRRMVFLIHVIGQPAPVAAASSVSARCGVTCVAVCCAYDMKLERVGEQKR